MNALPSSLQTAVVAGSDDCRHEGNPGDGMRGREEEYALGGLEPMN